MRSVVTLFVLILGLTVQAVANCGNDPCTCGSAEAHAAHEAEHAAEATVTPPPNEVHGGISTQLVELEPTRFAIYKGVLADASVVHTGIIEQTTAQGLTEDNSQHWSIMPRMPMSEEELPNMEYWAARTISDSAQPGGDLEVFVAPGGKYAMRKYIGPYEQLGDAWEAFAQQAFQVHSVDMERPMLEHYVSDHDTTPAEELVTLLYIPVL